MPKSCAINCCTNNKNKCPDKSFFLIPQERSRRNSWLAAISRALVSGDGNGNQNKRWSPHSSHHYVCSDHFITGKCSVIKYSSHHFNIDTLWAYIYYMYIIYIIIVSLLFSGQKVNDASHPDFIASIFPTNNKKTCSQDRQKKRLDRHDRHKKRTLTKGKESCEKPVRKRLHLEDMNMSSSCSTFETTSELLDFTIQSPGIRSPDENVATASTPIEIVKSEVDVLREEIQKLKEERNNAFNLVHALNEEKEQHVTLTDSLKEELKALKTTFRNIPFTCGSIANDDANCLLLTVINWQPYRANTGNTRFSLA